MNYSQIMSPVPLCLEKWGVMTPQLLWERRPCHYFRIQPSLYHIHGNACLYIPPTLGHNIDPIVPAMSVSCRTEIDFSLNEPKNSSRRRSRGDQSSPCQSVGPRRFAVSVIRCSRETPDVSGSRPSMSVVNRINKRVSSKFKRTLPVSGSAPKRLLTAMSTRVSLTSS